MLFYNNNSISNNKELLKNIYYIDPIEWNIKRDGQGDPVTNTVNIQSAIDNAVILGYDAVYLPKGNYLVGAVPQDLIMDNKVLTLHDGISLYMHNQTIIQLASNNYANYDIVRIFNSDNSCIYGGQIIGDRLIHDFGVNLQEYVVGGGNNTGVNEKGAIVPEFGSSTFILTKVQLDSYRCVLIDNKWVPDAVNYTHIAFRLMVDVESLAELAETSSVSFIGVSNGVQKLRIDNIVFGYGTTTTITKAQYDAYSSSDTFIFYLIGHTFKFTYNHSTLFLPNNDTRNYRYPTHEFGNGINIKNSKNNIISTVISEVTGDCIFIGGVDVASNFNIVLDGCSLTHARRNCLTLNQGDTILIKDTYIGYAKGTSPHSGVDIEPDLINQNVKNVIVDNVTIDNCYGYTVISSVSGSRNNYLRSIDFKNCTIDGSFYITNVPDRFTIDKCAFASSITKSLQMNPNNSPNYLVTNSSFDSIDSSLSLSGIFRNCIFSCPTIATYISTEASEITNCTFKNVFRLRNSNANITFISTVLSDSGNIFDNCSAIELKKTNQSSTFKLSGLTMINNSSFQAGTGFTVRNIKKCSINKSNISGVGKTNFIDCNIVKGDNYGWDYYTNVTYIGCNIEADVTTTTGPFSGNANYINCHLICNNDLNLVFDTIFKYEYGINYTIRNMILQNSKVDINGVINNVLGNWNVNPSNSVAILNQFNGSSLTFINTPRSLETIPGIGYTNSFDYILITQPNIKFTKNITVLSDINKAIKGQIIFDSVGKFKLCSKSSIFDVSGSIMVSAIWGPVNINVE